MLMMLSVSSCATSGPQRTTDVICDVGPFIFKNSDIVNTKLENQIISLNEYGEKHCKWVAP